MAAVSHVLRFDGGARSNPGPAAAGFVIFHSGAAAGAGTAGAAGAGVGGGASGVSREGDLRVVCEAGKYLGSTTNNVAEYNGLILGLEAAIHSALRNIRVEGDSKLVLSQVKGEWKVNKTHLQPLCERARALAARVNVVAWTWIPRERNQYADRLCNEAIDRKGNVGANANMLTLPSPTGAGAPVVAAAAANAARKKAKKRTHSASRENGDTIVEAIAAALERTSGTEGVGAVAGGAPSAGAAGGERAFSATQPNSHPRPHPRVAPAVASLSPQRVGHTHTNARSQTHTQTHTHTHTHTYSHAPTSPTSPTTPSPPAAATKRPRKRSRGSGGEGEMGGAGETGGNTNTDGEQSTLTPSHTNNVTAATARSIYMAHALTLATSALSDEHDPVASGADALPASQGSSTHTPLTEEQRRRKEENRQRALELRRKRALGMD